MQWRLGEKTIKLIIIIKIKDAPEMSDNFSNTLGATYLNIILKLIVFILDHVRHFC